MLLQPAMGGCRLSFNFLPMFHNYLKLAFRNLSRQKAFSIINIAGLAVGLASSLTILLWVEDEMGYDKFNSKADRTYRITAAAGDLKVATVPVRIGPGLQEAIPEIVLNTRVWREPGVLFQKDGIKFEEPNTFYVEPSLFDVFDFKLLHGDSKTALNEVRGAVVSEATAIKYFGTTDVLGKTITKGADEQFTITGVLANAKIHSHLNFDILLPWAHLATWHNNVKKDSWEGSFEFYTYVTFDTPKDEAWLSMFNKKVQTIFYEHNSNVQVEFNAQKVTDIHLHSQLMADLPGNGNYQYVAALTLIAVVIVLIGCINFMNLSTARSAQRAKEVGLRKVAGAMRAQLVRQFLGESILVTMLALAIALLIVMMALPFVNDLVGKQLGLDLAEPRLLTGIAVAAIVTGLVSGIYPAIVLSGFTPIKVLKRDVKSGAGGSVFRNVLVVMQFAISIVLLVGTTVIYRQLNFIRSRDIGYDKENLLYVNIHGYEDDRIPKWRAAFKSHPETSNVTFANALPTNLVSGDEDFVWQGKDPNRQIIFATLFVDDNFIPVFNVDLLTGRNFNHELRGDSSNFIINETAAKIMGFTPETAIGQKLEMREIKGQILGVVKDFNFKPLREVIEPMILRPNTWGNVAIIKADAGKIRETIAAMEKVWSSRESLYPFSFNFIDEDLENMYRSEQQVSTLFSAFAILAIMISCLGLYGLSAYIAEQRTREIGIRKALGASIGNIIYLLNTRFVIPVLIAMIISAPLAWYAMSRWLEGFAYKIDFSWDLVVLAGLVALMISLITVSYESVKAAKVNPVKSLRSE
jgi:putative ABC transport system permease protein